MTVFIGTKYSSDYCILYKISVTGKLPVSVPCFLVAYVVWVDVPTPTAHAERYVQIGFWRVLKVLTGACPAVEKVAHILLSAVSPSSSHPIVTAMLYVKCRTCEPLVPVLHVQIVTCIALQYMADLGQSSFFVYGELLEWDRAWKRSSFQCQSCELWHLLTKRIWNLTTLVLPWFGNKWSIFLPLNYKCCM